jgi:selenocysteine-specific elongation factor
LIKNRLAVAEGGWLLEAEWWAGIAAQAADIVQSHHKIHPEAQGISLSQLRSELGSDLPNPKLFDVLISHLIREGFARNADFLRSGHHRAALPLALESAGHRLREAFAQTPYDPPNPSELARTPTDQRALRFLIENGEVIDLGEKAAISRQAYEKMKAFIVSILRDRNQATASELREMIGTTRRILIPLLEKLDREGITRRSGDFRSLRP